MATGAACDCVGSLDGGGEALSASGGTLVGGSVQLIKLRNRKLETYFDLNEALRSSALSPVHTKSHGVGFSRFAPLGATPTIINQQRRPCWDREALHYSLR